MALISRSVLVPKLYSRWKDIHATKWQFLTTNTEESNTKRCCLGKRFEIWRSIELSLYKNISLPVRGPQTAKFSSEIIYVGCSTEHATLGLWSVMKPCSNAVKAPNLGRSRCWACTTCTASASSQKSTTTIKAAWTSFCWKSSWRGLRWWGRNIPPRKWWWNIQDTSSDWRNIQEASSSNKWRIWLCAINQTQATESRRRVWTRWRWTGGCLPCRSWGRNSTWATWWVAHRIITATYAEFQIRSEPLLP